MSMSLSGLVNFVNFCSVLRTHQLVVSKSWFNLVESGSEILVWIKLVIWVTHTKYKDC